MLNLEPPHFTQALAQRLDDDLQSYSRGLSLSNASAGECSVFVQPSQRFSTELSYGRHTGPPAHDSRRAAVITLLYWQHDEWFIPLTLRPTHLQDHGGQVSLPGGALESEENRPLSAASEVVMISRPSVMHARDEGSQIPAPKPVIAANKRPTRGLANKRKIRNYNQI